MKLFVYGTLKRGYGNHRLLRDATFLGQDTTTDKFMLVDCGFPYMFRPKLDLLLSGIPEKRVVGEVFETFNPEIVKDLDRLEGVEYGHYSREVIEVEEFGEVQAYIACSPSALPPCPVVNDKYVWGHHD